MPYITKDKRVKMDAVVQAMKDANVKIDGDLNYILFKFIKETIPPGYNAYKNVIGELECCKHEIYRVILAPYEFMKRQENGDV